MYLRSSQEPRRKNNFRLRIWLLLALAYAATGLVYLRQERPIAFIDPVPTPVVTPTPSTIALAEELLARGDLYWQQGNQTAARESYQEAVAADPELAIAYARWGMLLTLQLKTEEALIRTTRAVELAPDDPEVLVLHGMALEWSGRIPDSIRYFQEALAINPDYATAHAMISEAYVDSQRFEEALASAQLATELEPNNMWGWRNLGWVYESLGRYSDALVAYQRALDIQPLSYLYMRMGRNEFAKADANYQQALDYFRRATEVDPRNPQAYAELGRAYWLLEDYPTAIETLQQGIEQDPSYGINYAYLGYVHYTQRNFEQAIVELQQSISFGYTSEAVYYHLGLSLAYLEECDSAVGWLERALEINPESQPAQSGMRLCVPGWGTTTGG
jgi:tetratricopeptide (TPR) repeat protein